MSSQGSKDDEQSQHSGSESGSYHSSDESDYESEICYETFLTPTDSEKKSILAFAYELRTESTFCDVAFLVKGNLFRAHRVIVGSWSRWLRSLLSDGPEEEVVCLDMFTPDAFGCILDYMYGKPFQFSVDTAEGYMKILRRLEMQQLEQQCWQFLVSAIDATNCEKLHELADVFDCPPLKLCAWRILQESVPGYAVNPGRLGDMEGEEGSSYQLKGNGLTGPCDFDEEEEEEDDFDEDADEDADAEGNDRAVFPTIFKPDTFEGDSESGSNSDVANTIDRETVAPDGTTIYASSAGGDKSQPPPHPNTLPPTATASEVVRAWSAHLEYIHSQCNAPSGTRFSRRGNRNWERSFQRRRGRGRRSEDDASSLGSIQIRPQTGERDGIMQQASRIYQSFASPSKSRQGQGGGGEFDNKTITLKETVDWHAELTGFYEGIEMHNKVADLDNIMASWQGKEDLMLESLMKKYQTHLDRNRDLGAHLHKLLRYIHGNGNDRAERKQAPQMRGGRREEEEDSYYDN